MFKKLIAIYRLIRKDIWIIWYARKVPGSPKWLNFAIFGTLLYIISPFDIAPDWFLGMGQLDDIAIAGLAVNMIMRFLPDSVKKQATALATSAQKDEKKDTNSFNKS